jgi:hypothetical protein
VSRDIGGEILTRLGFMPDEEPPADELERAFDDHERRMGPLIVELTVECDEALLRQLRAEHPRVVFLVLTRSPDPDQLALGDVEVLHPLINAESERVFHRRYFEMTGTR